jgi:hypothetical protein
VEGTKEGEIVRKPWVAETDFWVFGSRCVYLFGVESELLTFGFIVLNIVMC